jgi:hypothetical protein
MSDHEAFSYTVQLQRGETDDRDKHKCTVTAHSIDELEQKVEQVRRLMRSEISETRTISGTPDSGENHQTFDKFEQGEA